MPTAHIRTDIAKAVVLAFTNPKVMTATAPVTQVNAQTVDAAFAQGRPILETGGYKVHASRREAPGMAEVHVRDTDIIYVLSGKATIVTGGLLVGANATAGDEIRGTSIEGGDSRVIAKGDVLIVPNGVPHWFEKVEAPFLYYVVKATAPSGGTE